MKTKTLKWNVVVALVLFISLFTACTKDEPAGVGEAEIQITDAPSDDASIKNVFVTVTEIRVDGHAISGFTKQTIDLKAYQSGSVKSLGITQLSSGTHGQITFVFDTDHDANGNEPGCYVQTNDNAKFKLATSGNVEVTISKAWNVAANSKSTIIADFDLRKAIKASSDQAVRYTFSSSATLMASIRVVEKSNTGTLNGTYAEQSSSNSDKVIVYAYKKGTFDANTETQAQGDDAVYFKNAVSSAEVVGTVTKNYTLAFIEQGEYELHFASYTFDSNSGHYNLHSMLTAQLSVNGSVADFIFVNANATISVSSTINL